MSEDPFKRFSSGSDDPLYAEAIDLVRERGKPSISQIQRKFKLGFNRAADMVKAMEEDGIIDEASPYGKVIK